MNKEQHEFARRRARKARGGKVRLVLKPRDKFKLLLGQPAEQQSASSIN